MLIQSGWAIFSFPLDEKLLPRNYVGNRLISKLGEDVTIRVASNQRKDVASEYPAKLIIFTRQMQETFRSKQATCSTFCSRRTDNAILAIGCGWWRRKGSFLETSNGKNRTVENEQAGYSESEQQRIFESIFTGQESPPRRNRGTGLGLLLQNMAQFCIMRSTVRHFQRLTDSEPVRERSTPGKLFDQNQ